MPKKNLQYYETLPYRVDLYFDKEDQVWIARYPELPGRVAHGATKEEALVTGEEVKSLWLEVALEKKHPIAEPQDELPYSGKLIRLPKTLHARAAEAASQEGVSLNTYLVQMISEGTMLSGVATSFARFAGGILQKFLRRLDPSSQASSLKILFGLSVEPVYGQDKEPLPASELERLASESPESVREQYAK